MSKIELIYTIVLVVLAISVAIYYFVLAIKNGWIKQITQTMNSAIRFAEFQEPKWSASKKKAYVLSEVEAKCDQLGIPYTLISKLVNKAIERIVADHNVIDHGEQ